jgi:hypothetical protein
MHEATYDKNFFASGAGKSGIVAFPILVMANGITINVFDGHSHCRLLPAHFTPTPFLPR